MTRDDTETREPPGGESGYSDTETGRAKISAGKSEVPRLSVYQRGRELGVRSAALGLRMIGPALRKWRSFRWTAALHANARQVGPGVHLYGPVRFLGTGNVYLGGWGNLYDNVLFETVDTGAIRIGDNFRINRGCLLSAHAGITLGDNCLIGEQVSVRDNNHVFDDRSRPVAEQGYRAVRISVGDDVWIGRGAVLLAGVTIGRGAVIAANSVITKDVPAMEVWAGVPAKFLRRRGETDTL